MIRFYTDHAANERTFLAWLRTGVAVIAFGFLVERFDLFILTMADAVAPAGAARERLEALSHSFGRGRGGAHPCRHRLHPGRDRPLRAYGRLVRRSKDPRAGNRLELSLSVILAILLIAASLPLILPSL